MTGSDVRTAARVSASMLLVCFLLAAVIVSAGCREAGEREAASGTVRHVVICWLKEPGDRAARERIIEVSRGFAEIPGVLDVQAGRVLPSDRAIVDSTFDVAIVISFPDARALADYLEHPRHEEALRETLRPLVERIVVYDFVE